MKLFVKIFAFFFFKDKRSEQGCFEERISYTGSALFPSVRVEDGETAKGLLSFVFFCSVYYYFSLLS